MSIHTNSTDPIATAPYESQTGLDLQVKVAYAAVEALGFTDPDSYIICGTEWEDEVVEFIAPTQQAANAMRDAWVSFKKDCN